MSAPDEQPIAAGQARLAVTAAFGAVAKALGELETAALTLESVATACARALDATTQKETTP